MTSQTSGHDVVRPAQPSAQQSVAGASAEHRRGDRRRRPAVALLALLPALLAVVLLGPAPAQASTNGVMVTVGDSVASGMHCGCTPFPQQYAASVARASGRSVTMRNLAFAGAETTDVISQLTTASARSAVRASGTALVMIGANDFGYAFGGVLAHERRAWVAFPRVARRVQANATQIVRTIQSLHPGITVVVADYWNVMKDGKVGLRTYGTWGESKAVQATTYANAALRQAASTTGARFVSTLTAFKGSSGTGDPTRLLASDGDHPNAAGHAVIATAFTRAASLG